MRETLNKDRAKPSVLLSHLKKTQVSLLHYSQILTVIVDDHDITIKLPELQLKLLLQKCNATVSL